MYTALGDCIFSVRYPAVRTQGNRIDDVKLYRRRTTMRPISN